ncbi:MAG: acyl-CoA dehydrogenase family protein [Candidatus Eremiobacteraeota bacterium]|nr:acyl-CoA dehydrogenase family protein [Candidatus Eremiobacteraeota bacterium]
MADERYRDWPFFEDRHRRLAAALEAWVAAQPAPRDDERDVDDTCRAFVAALGEAGWLHYAVPGDDAPFDVRALCLVREILGRWSALAEFAFAMQGLGTAAMALFGSAAQRARFLPHVRSGACLAGFALSEAGAGSDVGALQTRAVRTADGWRIDGTKTWISNGGIAGQYVVFARTDGDAPSTKGIGAFVVDAATPGVRVVSRIEAMAPHPLATLAFDDCRVPRDNIIASPGDGFKIAMTTLDVFRPSVGAAALGFARRAYDEALRRVTTRELFGAPMSALQLTQAKIADMATAIDTSALLVYRAAWLRDNGGARITREAAMAKFVATESAQRVIDDAVQIFGGLGVERGHPVERLYREIRALRIYEGATEVQKIIIARHELGGVA